jgi:cell division protein FtsB
MAMKKLFRLFSNKYLLATAAFIAWMLFFDHNDFMSQWDYHIQLTKLRNEKAFYQKETEKVKKSLEDLSTNKESFERFARERYRMKKDNEDIFVIVTEKTKSSKKSLF